MILGELKAILREHQEKHLLFVLPGGDSIPPDFHVTEVGHVVKNFVDCGGTVRSTAACVLQAWTAANDHGHRLSAGKLASILELARAVVPSDDLDVEIEYESCGISQYPLVAGIAKDGALTFTLGRKHTDCLAREACGLEPSACCGTDSCCEAPGT